jgi:hypothetical protein
MFVYFTDATSQQKIAINPKQVVAVFTVKEGEMAGKTAIGVVNGSVLVEESQIDVVGTLQGQL